MFPLAGAAFPSNETQLHQALVGGLEGLLASGHPRVELEADAFPTIRRLHVDLSHCQMDPHSRPQQAVGPKQSGITVARLDVLAHPLQVLEASLDVDLAARDALFDFDQDARGRSLLVLSDAADGHLRANINKVDLEELLLSSARAAAAKSGITIEGTELELTSVGERSVEVHVRVTARKFFAAVVRISGRLDIDQQLTAQVSNLSCEGEGMVGSLARHLLEGHLKCFEGYRVPLTAFSQGEVRLRDLRIHTDDGLEVQASFGREV